jgi:hypothetical protein
MAAARPREGSVSQPNYAEPPESDPLLAFLEEHEKTSEPPAAPTVPVASDDLRTRVERAERQIERALIDITTLRSDLATLVSAVEDIRKGLSRPAERPAPVMPLPARKMIGSRIIATILVLIALGAAMWGLVSTMTYDELPQPPRIQSESGQIGGETLGMR